MQGGSGAPEDKVAVGKATAAVQQQPGFNYSVANLYAPAYVDLAAYAEHKMRLLAQSIL